MGSNILWGLPTSREQRVPERLQHKCTPDASVLKDDPCRLFGTLSSGGYECNRLVTPIIEM